MKNDVNAAIRAAHRLKISGMGYGISAITDDKQVTVLAVTLANPNTDDENIVGIN